MNAQPDEKFLEDDALHPLGLAIPIRSLDARGYVRCMHEQVARPILVCELNDDFGEVVDDVDRVFDELQVFLLQVYIRVCELLESVVGLQTRGFCVFLHVRFEVRRKSVTADGVYEVIVVECRVVAERERVHVRAYLVRLHLYVKHVLLSKPPRKVSPHGVYKVANGIPGEDRGPSLVGARSFEVTKHAVREIHQLGLRLGMCGHGQVGHVRNCVKHITHIVRFTSPLAGRVQPAHAAAFRKAAGGSNGVQETDFYIVVPGLVIDVNASSFARVATRPEETGFRKEGHCKILANGFDALHELNRSLYARNRKGLDLEERAVVATVELAGERFHSLLVGLHEPVLSARVVRLPSQRGDGTHEPHGQEPHVRFAGV